MVIKCDYSLNGDYNSNGIYVENYIYKKLKESVEICKNQTKIQRFRENI